MVCRLRQRHLPQPLTGTTLYHRHRHIPGRASRRYQLTQMAPKQPTIILPSLDGNAVRPITYYPLFSSSTDPSAPAVQTQTINLAAPIRSRSPHRQLLLRIRLRVTPHAAWNAAGTQRLPALYPWVQPSPSPSGPSVKWVEMHDPHDPDRLRALPYTRYAYWAEDLDGYLDASQVGGQPRTTGTSPHEIAMFTIFDPTQQTDR